MAQDSIIQADRAADRIASDSLWNTAYQTWQAADHAAAQLVDRYFRIGGYAVRLRFAGPALVPYITPALDHLTVPPDPAPDLTVHLWDSASTGVAPPPSPVPDGAGSIHANQDGARIFFAAFDTGAGVLSLLDFNAGQALYWARDAHQIPYYESGAPLRVIFHLWMQRHGRQLVHAGAVGTGQTGALIVGRSGSGKSTTALACLQANLSYVGDDYVLLQATPQPCAHSLYNTGKLDPQHAQRFTNLQPAIRNVSRLDTEKALMFMHAFAPDQVAPRLPVSAILLSRITGLPETRVVADPAARVAAFRALAPSTILQLPGAGQESLQFLAEFVRQVPVYHLDLGTRLAGIAPAIRALLSGDAGAPVAAPGDEGG
jgi:hypothetical protein